MHLPKHKGQNQEVTLEQMHVFKVLNAPAFLTGLDTLCNYEILTCNVFFCKQDESPVSAMTLSKKKV